jgi:resuscitation-promoting factor RpfB
VSRPQRARSRLRWLAVPITLAAFSVLTVGYLSSFTPARIVDNGRTIEVRTLQSSVDGVLRDAGVELRPEDVVEPALDAQVKRDTTITITRARLVRLTLDGSESRLIRTQHNNARQLLIDAGFTLGLYDALRVNGEFVETIPAMPRLSANSTAVSAVAANVNVTIDPVVAEIDVRRAVPLAIHEDDRAPMALQTTASTVGEALLQAGHLIYLADRVQPDPGTLITADMKIVVQRAKPVTVWVDGRAVRSRTHSKSVSDLLAEMNVILLENDYTKPGLNEPVAAGMEVRVVRVSRQVQIRQETVPFQSRWEADPELEIDNTALSSEGAPGVREQRDVVIYEDGLEVKRERVADFVAQPVQDRINTYGTKIVIRTLDTPNGPVQYWRKIRMLATSYSASTAGVSRSKSYYGVARCGQAMRRGIVAVDPRLIPLGTNVYVAGYGVGFACDTGSGILGKRIDLGYGDLDLEWWSRYVDVYILTPAPPTPRYRLE